MYNTIRHIHWDFPPATAVVRRVTAPEAGPQFAYHPPVPRLPASGGGGMAPFFTERPLDAPAEPPANPRPGLNAP